MSKVSDESGNQPDEMSMRFARVFSTADGQEVLRELQRLTRDRVIGMQVAAGDPAGCALYHLEGQRYVVHMIASRVMRGNARRDADS